MSAITEQPELGPQRAARCVGGIVATAAGYGVARLLRRARERG